MSDDKWQDRQEEIVLEKKEALEAVEEERAFLKDRSIGGELAPRPTDEFIDQSLGPELSGEEINKIAGDQAERQVASEQVEAAQAQEVEVSRRRSAREIMAEQQEQEQERDR